jgi:hypothetical protein
MIEPDAEAPLEPAAARHDAEVDRFLTDLRLVARQYAARAPAAIRPAITAEMDQALTEARMRLGSRLRYTERSHHQ